LKTGIKRIFHIVEKGRQEGEPEFLGVLFGAIRNRGHEGRDVLGCDGGYLYIPEIVLEITQDELIVPQCIFFCTFIRW
jgi:hypothetical protein